MDTSLTKRNYAKQSHLIISARYGLSVREINMILTLLTAIDKEDTDFKDYVFTLADFKDKTDITLTTSDLNKIIKGLMSKPLEIKISDKNWEMFNWFSYFRFKDGVITCRFDKALKPYLLDLKERFVTNDLKMILPMRSSYSKRVYLLLKEYAKIGSRTFDIQELQELLKVPQSHKNRYAKFKSEVLKKAEIDINKFTDLDIELSERKRCKKVIEITYTIKKNRNDLKSFIGNIRDLYTNVILDYTKDNKPIKCSEKGFLYYGDSDKSFIDKKEAQKLWEYLHENRKNLYVFQESLKETKQQIDNLSMERFKEKVKNNFANKQIIQVKKDDKILDISIFPNGRLYEMNGEMLDNENIIKIWNLLVTYEKEGKLKNFEE